MDDSHINELLDEVESELERVKEVEDILDEVEHEIRKEDIDRVLDEIEREVVEKERMEPPENAPTGDDLERYDSEQTGAKAVEDVVEGAPDTVESRVEQDEVSETAPHEDTIDPQTASIEDIEKTVEHHQHLERKLSKKQRQEYADYKDVMAAPDDETSEDIAQQCERDVAQVESWRECEKFPTVVRRAMTYETARMVHESEVPAESREHRIELESVKEVLEEYREKESLSVNEKSDIVERIYRPNQREDSVVYAELYERGVPLVEDRFREIAREIRAERGAIEEELNRRLGLDTDPNREVRIAVTDSRIYYWNKDANPDRWLNALYDQKIYFKEKESKLALIDETVEKLHVRGGPEESEIYLNDLLGQLSRVNDVASNRTRRYGKNHYFEGEIYQFIGDVQNKTLDDFKPMMSHMGISDRGRVDNLKWPELREFRVRTVAIIESDGHLTPKGQLKYFEKEIERLDIVIKHFSEFGDFEVKRYHCKDGTTTVNFPMIFGAMTKYWEVPEGDKAIRNLGLPECIINECNINKGKYLEEVVGEDGYFSSRYFGIARGNVLSSGKKIKRYEESYGIKPCVSKELIDFVKDHGHPLPESIGYKDGERIGLYASQLKELTKSEDSTISSLANRLQQSVFENPNRLLVDERNEIITPLGIQTSISPTILTYYVESRRLSVMWRCVTKNRNSTIRWALLAPPNHPRKMNSVVEFIYSEREHVSKTKQEIENEGLQIHPIWREYGI